MQKSKPLRQCVVCRDMKEKKDLLRVVCTEDGMLRLDPTGKMPGRGAYICKEDKCFQSLEKSRGLDRSLKRRISQEAYKSLSEEFRLYDK